MCPPRLRKSAGTKVERLSLTQAEVNEATNGTVHDSDLIVEKSLTWYANFACVWLFNGIHLFSQSHQEFWGKVFGANASQVLVSVFFF